MTEKIYTIDEIRSNIFPIARRYGVERVYLFGSYARGDYDEESDIDVMIMVDMSREELRKYRAMYSELFSDINLENGVFLTSKLQSKEYFEKWQYAMPFYQNILREGIKYAWTK